jgi:hypothetical protein
MKPLPDLQDVEAMAAIGRVSALWSARNQTLEQLRDKLTAMNSAEFGLELETLSTEALALCARLNQIAMMWGLRAK